MQYIKKLTAVIILTGLTCGQGLQAQTSSFNFTAAAVSVSGWTNVSGDPSTGVRSVTDGATGISISSVSTSNWAGLSGSAAYNGGGVTNGTFFPANVMRNHWFQATAAVASYNAAIPQLIISGLNIDSVYTVSMTGSWNDAYYNMNPTRYTVTGATVYGYVDVNLRYNTSNGAVFRNVAPNASGQIKIYVNTISTTDIAGISGLQIIRGRTNGAIPSVQLTSPSNNVTLPEDANVTISATAAETGGTIGHVEFYLDSVKIGDDSVAPYNLQWIAANPGNYILKARAIDGFGNTNTSTIHIGVENLNYFWSTTGNIATSGDTFYVGTVDSNRLAFRTKNIERMSISATGDVGIGVSNTQGYKLAVNGAAIFTKVKVKTAGTWPDYVFEKGFKLPGLADLEKYLVEHKHLPDMVSAAEAQKDGIDVAAQQAVLLKKIEELTLYLIEENKQLKEQSKKIHRLERLLQAKK